MDTSRADLLARILGNVPAGRDITTAPRCWWAALDQRARRRTRRAIRDRLRPRRGATPLLYTRDAARLQDLPVYLKTLNIRLADETTPLEKLIDEYLGSVKAKRLSSLAQ